MRIREKFTGTLLATNLTEREAMVFLVALARSRFVGTLVLSYEDGAERDTVFTFYEKEGTGGFVVEPVGASKPFDPSRN